MSVNAREENYEHVELFGKPALFTNSRIDRATVPKGFSCYDLRGSDRDPGKPATVETQVAVNHAGTILTPKPVTIPKEGFRRLGGKLNFLGECMTLSEFCEEHGLDLAPDNRKFILRPASPDEAGLFYSHDKKDAEIGTVGHLRADFGHGGNEFWHTWWPHNGDELNTPELKAELQEFVDELRKSGPLRSLSSMSGYCCDHNAGKLDDGSRGGYGYIADSENYRYCLRCTPIQGDYNAYLYIYDKRQQELNMKNEVPKQDYGLTAAGKQKLQNAADGTLPHGYSWFVFQDYNLPGEKLTGDLTLPEAIRLYNETDSGNKRLGVTKDEIATVDFVITLDGKQQFTDDYTHLASFSSDAAIAEAVETLRNEIPEQTSEQGMTMGGMQLG